LAVAGDGNVALVRLPHVPDDQRINKRTRAQRYADTRKEVSMVGRAKPVGIGNKPLKSELHHWWPRALSRLWEDEDGRVTRLSWDRKELKAPPKQFGAITNAHHMKFGGPWSTTIEPLFGDADTSLPMIAQKLEQFSYVEGKSGLTFEGRLAPHPMGAEDRKCLGEGLARVRGFASENADFEIF
jgi:hypothetical protein